MLALGYVADRDGIDLVSEERHEAYDIKLRGRGVRDVRNGVLGLATFLGRHPDVERGYVLTSLVRISAARVRAEWERVQRVLRPEIGARMRLVAVVEGGDVVEAPPGQRTRVVEHFLEWTKEAAAREGTSAGAGARVPRGGSTPGVSWKHLEVEKVLLHRRLLGEGPVRMGTLSDQVGCSYPTAMEAVRRLSAEGGLIERGRGRSVGLGRYPRERWPELFRVQRLVYPPEEFVNPMGEPGAVEGILRRLNRVRPKGAALGGVAAARRWDPSFDLNGTPRVDLVLHTPLTGGRTPATWAREAGEFVGRLDPALRPRGALGGGGATVLVIHRTYRREGLFLEDPGGVLPWADPVEVLYHLNEIGLTAQAGEMVRRLRRDVKV